MTSIFDVALKSIFNTQVAVSGVLTDSSSNQYSIRCVIDHAMNPVFDGWETKMQQNRVEITVLKSDIAGVIEATQLEIDGKTYKVDGIVADDEWTTTYSVIEN